MGTVEEDESCIKIESFLALLKIISRLRGPFWNYGFLTEIVISQWPIAILEICKNLKIFAKTQIIRYPFHFFIVLKKFITVQEILP